MYPISLLFPICWKKWKELVKLISRHIQLLKLTGRSGDSRSPALSAAKTSKCDHRHVCHNYITFRSAKWYSLHT